MSALPLLVQIIHRRCYKLSEIQHKLHLSINGQKIRSIRFVDDIALIAESEGDLNLMLQCLDATLTKFSLKINIKKTKVLVVNKSVQQNAAYIKIRDESVEQVKEFCYLGSLITEVTDLQEKLRE